MYLLKPFTRAIHYLIYLTYKTFKGEGLFLLNAICFLYLIEMSFPFAFYLKNGFPIYIAAVLSTLLAFYNDYVYNTEIIEKIEIRFDQLKFSYALLVFQFLVFLFLPFVVLISLIKI